MERQGEPRVNEHDLKHFKSQPEKVKTCGYFSQDSMNRFKTSLMSRSGSGLMLSLGEYTTSDNELSNTGE